MPKLSIITINLNNKSGLSKTIESVISQNYQDFEYIVIDGASTDGSADVIKKYSSGIAYWVSEEDSGIYQAMNKGIRKAKGEYCLFLNSGDWLVDQSVLEKVFSSFPQKDIVYGNLQTPNGLYKYPDKLTFYNFFVGSLPHPAAFIKKSLFDSLGYYDEQLRISSDWVFFVNAIIKHQRSYEHIEPAISFFNFEGISEDEKWNAIMAQERNDYLKTAFPLMYADYLKMIENKNKLEFYENSRLIRAIKKIKGREI